MEGKGYWKRIERIDRQKGIEIKEEGEIGKYRDGRGEEYTINMRGSEKVIKEKE